MTKIGQKTTDLNKVQSQYMGLMRFREGGLQANYPDIQIVNDGRKSLKEMFDMILRQLEI